MSWRPLTTNVIANIFFKVYNKIVKTVNKRKLNIINTSYKKKKKTVLHFWVNSKFKITNAIIEDDSSLYFLFFLGSAIN